tara:strand:- start:122555 stop:126100 length:3546 start_codon:yes stop_codon:yes gene_type:complete
MRMKIQKFKSTIRWTVFLQLCFCSIFAQTESTLFKLLPASQTGIHFNNQLFESDTLNILNQANIYNGGGVGIGDFNKDGLMDVYFAGNMVSNKLYLNKGDLKFTDVTKIANVDGHGRWSTGVAVVDINGDTWPDIYVSASFSSEAKKRTNLLYVNQGLNENGSPVFIESAQAFGLADDGYSTQAYFFDYDKDGDLDMYQVINQMNDPKTPLSYRTKLVDGSAENNDRLYRNNGNGTFSDVSRQAGILIEGWGHAASIIDINLDGWPDIYVANDFISNDLCYINNGNGTFTNRLDDYFKHTGWNAMGTDFADINNDGYVDMISLEMLPENNLRKKRMLGGNEYYSYINNARFNYTHQYIRNMLQLNSGPTPLGHPIFEDISFLAGVYQTDWSWCPLVADFDNDGYRDLVITNGFPRDVTDLDYISYDNGQSGVEQKFTLAMTDSLPVVKLANYAYKNTNGILFENTSKAWGLDDLSFSNGGVYTDLDNDGDLDIIINNINGTAFVYENRLDNKENHLSVRFEGLKNNTMGIGANLKIYYDGQMQVYDHYPIRGYLSTDDNRAHIGLGKIQNIDSLIVKWPSENEQRLYNIKANRELTLSTKDALLKTRSFSKQTVETIFTDVTDEYCLTYKPKEIDFSDYNNQRTLPHKLSQYGPGIAVGDIDNNGYEDFYIGGSSENSGAFFMQDESGKFFFDPSRLLAQESDLYEDMGVLLFDADNDKDLDLYLVSGSYEIPENNNISNDRLFLNDGEGKFSRAIGALPEDLTNGSCVKAADFDGDGDLDLFIGGRVVSAAYPASPKSFLLKNENGKFIDVTNEYLPELKTIGMVTDALWSDFDNDGKADLIITGEWMSVTFLKNSGNSFEKISTGIEHKLGWWNSLVSGDFDADGDMDYIVGNLGLNSNYVATVEEPMTIIAKDIDDNGLLDAMVFCYMKGDDGIRKSFPIASRDDLVSQVISMRKEYPTYKSYGLAAMNDIWNDAAKNDAIILKATEMRSSYIENKGNGKFKMEPLPLEAQKAPVYGMMTDDIDNDGNLDVILVGNDYGMDPYSGRHDAFKGLCLQGNGAGGFKEILLSKTGFFVDGDAKGLTRIKSAEKKDILIATQNQGSLRAFVNQENQEDVLKWITLKHDDFSAEIIFNDGRKKHVEFYYGSTYLSQSSRTLPVPKNVKKITITNFKGKKRKVL